jgi:hypothetical protein
MTIEAEAFLAHEHGLLDGPALVHGFVAALWTRVESLGSHWVHRKGPWIRKLRRLWGFVRVATPRAGPSNQSPPFPSAPPVPVGRCSSGRGVSPHPGEGRRGQVGDPQAPRGCAER